MNNITFNIIRTLFLIALIITKCFRHYIPYSAMNMMLVVMGVFFVTLFIPMTRKAQQIRIDTVMHSQRALIQAKRILLGVFLGIVIFHGENMAKYIIAHMAK